MYICMYVYIYIYIYNLPPLNNNPPPNKKQTLGGIHLLLSI